MVSRKRLDYGFSGHRIPVVPKAPRSIRRRVPQRKFVEESEICAFELLATVAGKLLQESESSASSNAGEEKVHLGLSIDGTEMGRPGDDKPIKSESFDHGSCAESTFVPEVAAQEHNFLSNFNELQQAENRSDLKSISGNEGPDVLKKVDCDIKLGTGEDKNVDRNPLCKVEGFFPSVPDIYDGKVENGPDRQLEDERGQIGGLTLSNTSSVKDPMEDCVNNNVRINSDSSVQLPLYRDPISGSFPKKQRNDVNLRVRDDDENSFGCNKPSTKVRRLQPCSGHRRIRKMLASKYWKAAPKLKDFQLYNTSKGTKSFYRYRRNILPRDKCEQVPIKKRKLSDTFGVAYDQEGSSESISNLPSKSHRAASGTSASPKSRPKSTDPNVKLSIKSFRVPELYIEVPETATVGSLKRTVMEAVTAILRGGLRVGVVLQGKKVRDDFRTLQQAGISQSGSLDSLGFTLEPSFTRAAPSMNAKDRALVVPCEADRQQSRSPASLVFDSGISSASLNNPATPKMEKKVDAEHELITSSKTPSDTLTDGAVRDSKALVAVPPVNMEALAMVPVNGTPRRNELSHRRTRRPFSVAEVEALVEAVEKLGTGRWRDVKMRAFENADHRTYVDLKDKWKTLVHTASISPQQRRGEPVPQELLDRVLAAHAYWMQHQSKQHGKQNQLEPLKIMDSQVEMIRG